MDSVNRYVFQYKLKDAEVVSDIPKYWRDWETEGYGKIIAVKVEISLK